MENYLYVAISASKSLTYCESSFDYLLGAIGSDGENPSEYDFYKLSPSDKMKLVLVRATDE